MKFELIALLFVFLVSATPTKGDPLSADITCDEVVKRIGLKPLWLAERQVRKEFPDITEGQIAWGRKCVMEYRSALLKKFTR
jgi:hypothetical protein